MVVYVDSNIFVHILMGTELADTAKRIFRPGESFVTSQAALEEAIYVGLRLLAADRLNIRSAHQLRRHLAKHGPAFAYDYLSALTSFLRDTCIVILVDNTNIDDVVKIMSAYKLMPNDALIAATCKLHQVSVIATFDEDFRRVDFLQVIP